MGKKTVEENIYETDLRLTQNVLRRVQRILRDPKLQKPNLKTCAGIPEVEQIIALRTHGEFPTPLHEIVALNRILEKTQLPEVKRWAHQRIRNLRKRLETGTIEHHSCSGRNSARGCGPCQLPATQTVNGAWWCRKHLPK